MKYKVTYLPLWDDNDMFEHIYEKENDIKEYPDYRISIVEVIE